MGRWISIISLVAAVTAGCSGSSSGSPPASHPASHPGSSSAAAVESQLRSVGWTVVSSTQSSNQAICGRRASLRVDAQDRALPGGPAMTHVHLTVWLLPSPDLATGCELQITGQRPVMFKLVVRRPIEIRLLTGQVEVADHAGAYLLVASTFGARHSLRASRLRTSLLLATARLRRL